jgi:hypothetical protein
MTILSFTLFAADDAPAARLPLHILEATRAGRDRTANAPNIWAAVGSLPAPHPQEFGYRLDAQVLQAPYGLQFDGPHDTLTDLASGKIKLQRPLPNANSPTVVHLTTAMGDNYTYTVPTALIRKGNTFTLQCEHWYDNGPRDKTYDVKFEYLIALGQLPAGVYELRIELQSYLKDMQKGGHENVLYDPGEVKSGSVKFTLEIESANGVAPELNGLKDSAATAEKGSRQLPVRALGTAPRENHPEPGIVAGTLDIGTYLKSTRLEAPAITPPKASDPLYAVVIGPEVNLAEFATLRGIVWDGKKVTVQVELWRDDGPRKENVPSFPVLVIPLALPRDASAAAEYSINVEWTVLRAPRPQAEYLPDSPENQAKLKELKNTVALKIPHPHPTLPPNKTDGSGKDF